MRTLLLLTLVAACGKGASKEVPSKDGPRCAKYADMEIKCGDDTGEGARPTILEFCKKAADGAKDVMSQLLRLEIECAQTAADCPAYAACVEKAKKETTPE